MQELSDITSGLSELLQSSVQARAEEQERKRERKTAALDSKIEGATTGTPPNETSLLVPVDRNVLSSSEGLVLNLRRHIL